MQQLVNIEGYGTFRHLKRVRNMTLTKRDQHVNEMPTADKEFKKCGWSRFLIIVQNVNMVTNGKRNSKKRNSNKRNSRLNPDERRSGDCVIYWISCDSIN